MQRVNKYISSLKRYKYKKKIIRAEKDTIIQKEIDQKALIWAEKAAIFQKEKEQKEDIKMLGNLEKLYDFRNELWIGIDESATKLIEANRIILEEDSYGDKQLNGRDIVNLFEKGLVLIPESDASVAQAKIMLEELDNTVEDGAI